MTDIASDIFAYGLTAGVSPLAFLGTVAMLTTGSSGRNAVAFLAGFVVVIGVACVAAVLLASILVPPDAGDVLATLLKLLLGAVLLVAAWRERPGRPSEGDGADKLRSMLARFDDLTVSAAFGAGALLVALPRRVVTTILAGLAIGAAVDNAAQGLPLVLLYSLTASALIWGTIGLSWLVGSRSASVLQGSKAWFMANAATVVFSVSLLFGVLFTGQALISIVS